LRERGSGSQVNLVKRQYPFCGDNVEPLRGDSLLGRAFAKASARVARLARRSASEGGRSREGRSLVRGTRNRLRPQRSLRIGNGFAPLDKPKT